MAHWSSCAIHNGPALPVGECNCGNDAPEAMGKLIQFRPRSKSEGLWLDDGSRYSAPEKDPA